jgi:hypothetical protein
MIAVQLRPHPDVVWRRLDEEVVLVHLKTNRIYSLNPTAARFWELLSEGLDRQSLELVMLKELDVTEIQLRDELDSLIAELSREGLVS